MKTFLLTLYTIGFVSITLIAQYENIGFQKDLYAKSCCGEIELFNPSKSLMTDTVYCARWDFATNEFQSYSETVNTYDAKGRLTESKSGYYSAGNDLKYIFKKEYNYYAFDSVMSFTNYFWNESLNNGSWDNSQHIEYIYDTKRRLSVEEVFFSSQGNSSWQNSSRTYYTYLQNGLLNEQITQYWNIDANDWWNYLRSRYIYDMENMLIEKYIDYSNNSEGLWTFSSRYIYLKESCRNQQQEIHQTYMGPDWMNNSKRTFSVNKEKLSEEILKEFWNYNEMIWDTMFMERDIYDYNTEGKIIDHIYQSRYIDWFNVSREMYNYDEYGNLLESNSYEWNHNGQYWDENQKCTTKSTSNVLDIYTTDLLEFKLYPNPTNGILNIELGNKFYDDVKILLINSSGQILQELGEVNNNRKFSLDLSQYAFGTYFIDVEAEGTTRLIKKIIYQ